MTAAGPSRRFAAVPQPCHVGCESLPSEESLGAFIKAPDLQRHKADADLICGCTHVVKQRTGDALSSIGWPDADMMQMDLVPGMAKRRFRQVNDFGIGITNRFGIKLSNEEKIVGICEQTVGRRRWERIWPKRFEARWDSGRVQALDVGIEQ